MTAQVQIVSFGYGHGPAPQAHAVFDLRAHFKDPHVSPGLRRPAAADPRVMAAVLGTPGIAALVAAIAAVVSAFGDGPAPQPVTVAVGCVGGRHRSAAVAIEVATLLQAHQVAVTLTHRDIDRPVIERAAAVSVLPAGQEDCFADMLRDAIAARTAGGCGGCAADPSGVCWDCCADVARAEAYRDLGRLFGVEVPS